MADHFYRLEKTRCPIEFPVRLRHLTFSNTQTPLYSWFPHPEPEFVLSTLNKIPHYGNLSQYGLQLQRASLFDLQIWQTKYGRTILSCGNLLKLALVKILNFLIISLKVETWVNMLTTAGCSYTKCFSLYSKNQYPASQKLLGLYLSGSYYFYT